MLKTACRNSKNFRFYRTLKIGDFEPEMYLLLILLILIIQSFQFPFFLIFSMAARSMKFGVLIPYDVLQWRFFPFSEFPNSFGNREFWRSLKAVYTTLTKHAFGWAHTIGFFFFIAIWARSMNIGMHIPYDIPNRFLFYFVRKFLFLIDISQF